MAYVDSPTQRNYFLKDKSFLPSNFGEFSDFEAFEFWISYFRGLERKWKWNLLDSNSISKSALMANLKRFLSEGEGVIGCKVSLLKSSTNYKRIFESLRRFSLDLKIVTISQDSTEKLIDGVSKSLDYDDVLVLDLNSRFFKIYRAEKIGSERKKDLSKAFHPDYKHNTVKVRWENVDELLSLLKGGKYKTFLSQYLPSNLMSNIWGNFLLEPIFKTDSELLKDFIRAYITIQLLSVSTENRKLMRDFGVKPIKTLLWVTGDLAEMLDYKKLLVSIIDGLQLRGEFDFISDPSYLIYTFGKSFAMGEDSDEIILNREKFLPKITKVLVPEVDLKSEIRKVVFSGTLIGYGNQTTDVFAMSSEITEIKINDPKRTLVEGKFVKSAYIEKYRKSFELVCGQEGIEWEKIILDCRIKPVVYGPDIKANNIKLKMWLSGESYS